MASKQTSIFSVVTELVIPIFDIFVLKVKAAFFPFFCFNRPKFSMSILYDFRIIRLQYGQFWPFHYRLYICTVLCVCVCMWRPLWKIRSNRYSIIDLKWFNSVQHEAILGSNYQFFFHSLENWLEFRVALAALLVLFFPFFLSLSLPAPFSTSFSFFILYFECTKCD